MNATKILVVAAASLGLAGAAQADFEMDGSLAIAKYGGTSGYTGSTLQLSSVNFVQGTGTGDFATLVPELSGVTAYSTLITGVTTTPKAISIPDFLVFSGPSPLPPSIGGSITGTTPPNRFEFNLATLYFQGDGFYAGTGTIVDTTGGFLATPATMELGYSGNFNNGGNYSLTIAAVPVPEPANWAGALLVLPLGVWVLRISRRNQTA